MTDDQGRVAKDASGTPADGLAARIHEITQSQKAQKTVTMPLSAYEAIEPAEKPSPAVPPAQNAPVTIPRAIDLEMKFPSLSSAPIPMMESHDLPPILPHIQTTAEANPLKSYSSKTPLPPTLAPAPQWQASSAPIPVTPPTHPEMQRDIARILQETKLPERRDFRTAADAPQQATLEPIDTRITPRIAPVNEAQKAAEEALTPELRATLGRVRIVTPEAERRTHDTAPEKAAGGAPVGRTMPRMPTEEVLETDDATEAIAAGIVPEAASMTMIPSLRTLKDDLQQLIRVKKVSLVHAAALEVDRKHKSTEVARAEIIVQHKRRGRIVRFLASVGALIFLGGAALIVVTLIQSERTTPPQQQFATSLMFAEQTLGFPLTNEGPRALKERLSSARSQFNLTLGAMLRIAPVVSVPSGVPGQEVEHEATTEEFLDALSPKTVPPDLVRALSPRFFFAMHSVDENLPIVVVPVSSYQNAFAGMLAWEKSMNEDLSPLFTRVQYQKLDETGAPILVRFEDLVIRNYDVRALKDRAGNVKMLYSFPSRNLLIIAESPHTFVEALARLRAERRL